MLEQHVRRVVLSLSVLLAAGPAGAQETGAAAEGAAQETGAAAEGAAQETGAAPEGAAQESGAAAEGAAQESGAAAEGAAQETGAAPEGAAQETEAAPEGAAQESEAGALAGPATPATAGAAADDALDAWIDLGLTVPAVLAEAETRPGLVAVPPLRPFYDDHAQEDLAYTDAALLATGVLLPGAEGRPDTEVVLSGRVGFRDALVVRDDGSYLRLRWPTRAGRVVVTGYPFGADAIRVGYVNRLSIDAVRALPQAGLAPGLRAGLIDDWGYAWAATTAKPINERAEVDGVSEMVRGTGWSALAGVGAEALDHLRLEASGGWFRQGTNVQRSVSGEPVESFGAAARVTWAVDLPWETPVDYRPLVDDPFTTDHLFSGRAATRDGWALSASGLLSGQHLEDPDAVEGLDPWDPEFAGERTWQVGWGADLEAVVSRGGWQVDGFFRARAPALLLFETFGLVPFQAFTADAETGPELAGALQVARRFEPWNLTPRVSFGLIRPATVADDRVPTGTTPPPEPTSPRTIAILGTQDLRVLPEGKDVRLRVDGRVGLDARITDYLALSAEAVISHDPNRVETVRDPDTGLTVIRLDETFSWGVNLLARARF